ncbi:diguanylate cyclase [Pseudomonas luteola]|nr:diguanylate cyclase [Pseudomonas luteola]
MFFNAYVWPHIAYGLSRSVTVPYVVERRNLLIEAVMGGFWVAAMGLNALPSTMMISMYCLNSIAVGAPGLLWKSLLAQLAGLLTAWTLLGFKFIPETSHLQVYAYLPMLAIYPMAVGGAAYQLAGKLAQHKRALRDFSRLDSLTGVLNHGAWKESLEAEFVALQQGNRSAVLALIDIDRFKSINDTQGHLIGDEVIRVLSDVLKANCRASDIAGRVGGDEFAVLFKAADCAQARLALARLQQCFRKVLEEQNHLPVVTLSIGIVPYDQAMTDAQLWLKCSDQALYQAKHNGRDQLAQFERHNEG